MSYEKKFKNSDDQQFHQYQQNEKSPFTSNHWTKIKTMAYGIGNPDPGLWPAQKWGRVKPVNGIPNLPLLITGSPRAIQI